MSEELLTILRGRYRFLRSMMDAMELTINRMGEENDPEKVYEIMKNFLGEFPTRRMLQEIADEKGLKIKVRTEEDAIAIIKHLQDL